MNEKKHIGIDASNLRGGGGLTHLQQLFSSSLPSKHNFAKVTVWGSKKTLERLPQNMPWLSLRTHSWLEKNLLFRSGWRYYFLPKAILQEGIDILFSPGGIINNCKIPTITMSRNMLPFDKEERCRYKWGRERLRLELLRVLMVKSYAKTNGLIFLNDYAKKTILPQLNHQPEKISVIPHGVSTRFSLEPRKQKKIEEFSNSKPMQLLCVSTINVYKHQWHVVDAVQRLRDEGVPLNLNLVGGAESNSLARLKHQISISDPHCEFVQYHGQIPFEHLHELYHQADVFIFPSSCENMPNILLEAMSAGLPIICSNKGPMPELLGDNGKYYNPERPIELANALKELIKNPKQRFRSATAVFKRVQKYKWEICANETYVFIERVYDGIRRVNKK